MHKICSYTVILLLVVGVQVVPVRVNPVPHPVHVVGLVEHEVQGAVGVQAIKAKKNSFSGLFNLNFKVTHRLPRIRES